MPEGVAVIDRDHVYTYINPAGSQMMRRTAGDVVGKTVWQIYPDVKDSAWAQALDRVLAGGAAESSEMYYAPSDRWTLIGTYPVGDGIVIVWRDISELKRAHRALEQKLEEQREIEQLRERLLGIVGHDLRTPLTAIMATAERLIRRKSLTQADARIVSPILRSAKRMERMISQILDFTRIRLGGGFEIYPVPTDLVQVCREIISECVEASPEREIAFTGPDAVHGVWDRDRLCEVVSNLLGNALQHGAPDGRVEIELTASPGESVLRVRNRGKPIPGDILPFIFDPFRRARATREDTKPDSVGLGLFITKEIVSSHGGTMDVESSDDATVFAVRLPRTIEPRGSA